MATLAVVFVVLGLFAAYERTWWIMAPPWVAAAFCALIAGMT